MPKHQCCTNVSHNSCSFFVLKVHISPVRLIMVMLHIAHNQCIFLWIYSCLYLAQNFLTGCYNLHSFACFFLVTAILRKVLISLSVLKGSCVVIVPCSHVSQLSETSIVFSCTAFSWLEFVIVSFCNFNMSAFFLLLQN